jgi:hypothetical protein
MTWAAVAIGGASLVSGAMGSSAAKKQASQSKKALAFQMMQYQENKKNFSPFIQAGTSAQNQYMSQLGMGNEPAYDVTNMPGYQNALQQGLSAVNQGGAGAGMLMSGERLKGLQSTGQNIFGSYYNNYMDRLQGLQSQGLNAAHSLAGNQGAMVQQMTNTRGAIGDAQAQQKSQMAQGITGGLGALSGYMGSPSAAGGGTAPNSVGPMASGYKF